MSIFTIAQFTNTSLFAQPKPGVGRPRAFNFEESPPPEHERREGQTFLSQARDTSSTYTSGELTATPAATSVPGSPAGTDTPPTVESEAPDIAVEDGDTRWLKTRLDPRIGFSLSQVSAWDLGITGTDSPEMESMLNSDTPFFTINAGTGQARIPLRYDIFGVEQKKVDYSLNQRMAFKPFGKEGVVYLVPDFNTGYSKNYSIEEDDWFAGVNGGLSVYLEPQAFEKADFLLKLHGEVSSEWRERRWPAPATPSGSEKSFNSGVEFLIQTGPQLELRPAFDIRLNSTRYDAESLGNRDETVLFDGGEVGLKVFFKLDNNFTVEEGVFYTFGNQGIPEQVREGALTSDLRGLKTNTALHWNNFSARLERSREDLEGFDSTYETRFDAEIRGLYFERIEFSLGVTEGESHFYGINTRFLELGTEAPGSLVPKVGPFNLNWGASFRSAVYEDDIRKGDYFLSGGKMFMEVNL